MGGVVSVAQIIDKATVEVADSSGKQFEIARDWKIIMQAVVPVGQSGECIVIVYFVCVYPKSAWKKVCRDTLPSINRVIRMLSREIRKSIPLYS